MPSNKYPHLGPYPDTYRVTGTGENGIIYHPDGSWGYASAIEQWEGIEKEVNQEVERKLLFEVIEEEGLPEYTITEENLTADEIIDRYGSEWSQETKEAIRKLAKI